MGSHKVNQALGQALGSAGLKRWQPWQSWPNSLALVTHVTKSDLGHLPHMPRDPGKHSSGSCHPRTGPSSTLRHGRSTTFPAPWDLAGPTQQQSSGHRHRPCQAPPASTPGALPVTAHVHVHTWHTHTRVHASTPFFKMANYCCFKKTKNASAVVGRVHRSLTTPGACRQHRGALTS